MMLCCDCESYAGGGGNFRTVYFRGKGGGGDHFGVKCPRRRGDGFL